MICSRRLQLLLSLLVAVLLWRQAPPTRDASNSGSFVFLEAFAPMPSRLHHQARHHQHVGIVLFGWLNDITMDDDDDISQHVIMVNDQNMTTTTTKTTTTGGGGYRPIEAWHQDNRSPTHVLDSLKREQAHWKSKFEDLGGDGI